MRKTLGVGLSVGILALAGGAAAQDADPALIAAGKKVYIDNCAVCHGETLNPNPGVADLKRLRAPQRPRFNTVVMNGLAPEMPAWKGVITDGQLDELWAFILAPRP